MKTETCEILAKHRKRRHPPQAHYHTTYFQVQVKIMKNKTVNIILYQTLISKKDQKRVRKIISISTINLVYQITKRLAPLYICINCCSLLATVAARDDLGFPCTIASCNCTEFAVAMIQSDEYSLANPQLE